MISSDNYPVSAVQNSEIKDNTESKKNKWMILYQSQISRPVVKDLMIFKRVREKIIKNSYIR